MTLEDFDTRQGCFICNLPAEIRSEIDGYRIRTEQQVRDGMRKRAIGPDAVTDFLVTEHGYPDSIRRKSRSSANYHFGQKHHESR